MKVSEDLGLFVLPLKVLGCSVAFSLLEVGGYVETPLQEQANSSNTIRANQSRSSSDGNQSQRK